MNARLTEQLFLIDNKKNKTLAENSTTDQNNNNNTVFDLIVEGINQKKSTKIEDCNKFPKEIIGNHIFFLISFCFLCNGEILFIILRFEPK